LAGLVLFVLVIGFAAQMMAGPEGLFGPAGPRVALIRLTGVMYDSRKTVAQLQHFADDDRVKAIVIRVDTPGGGVAAAQEIYQAVRRLREEKGKYVVVSMGSVAASGGYYVACGADHVVANPGTITGSIGVIAEWYNYGELVDWAGLKPEVIKSGRLKDIGSPVREMTEEERTLLQGIIDQLYSQFLGVVVASRAGKKGLDEPSIRALADGRVFTGQEAEARGLVDELGDERRALLAAARHVGIEGEPIVVLPPAERRTTLLDLLADTDVGDVAAKALPGGSESGARLQFGYLWK
jgi:protease-4